MEINIRSVLQEEVPILQKMGWETFEHAFGPLNTKEDIEGYLNKSFSLEKIKEEYSDPHSFFYFALFNDTPIGYLKLNVKDSQTDYQDHNGMEVERIYVLPEYQGKKIGEQLIRFSIESAKNEKAELLWLGVWDQNTAAIRFYQRMGFKAFDSHSFLLGTDEQTDIVMKIQLS